MIAPALEPLTVPLDRLDLLPGNPRHGDVDAIAKSYRTFGQRKPIVARRTGGTDAEPTGVVIAGNHQLQAARQLGWDRIAVVWTDDDEETANAFALADNRTADLGTYDDAALADLIQSINDQDLIDSIGYDDKAIDEILSRLADDEPKDEPETPTAPANPITKRGDLWKLGDHAVMCGDCRDSDDVKRLLEGTLVNVAFTSPPYAQQRTYDESSGFKPIPPDEYVEWFEAVQANVRSHLADDGSWFVNIKPAADGLDTELYVFDLVLAHARQWGWHFATEFCWERGGVPKNVTRRFKNQFEPVYQFAVGEWKMRPEAVRHWSDSVPVPGGPGVGDTWWADAQGGNGAMFGARKRKNGTSQTMAAVKGEARDAGEFISPGMAFPGNRLPTFAGTHTATGHTAAFPVGLPAWFIRAYSDKGDAIYDPFMGSGSTLIAAHQENRVGYGIEISTAYCDVICKRFQQLTGIKPERNGEPHDFLEPTEGP